MKYIILFIAITITYGCRQVEPKVQATPYSAINETDSIKDFREFKVLDSKHINNKNLWQPFENDLKDFNNETYMRLKPLIIEKDIPTIQQSIYNGALTYENLVKFYLYRIRTFDRENKLSLNAVISLNPNVIAEARQNDRDLRNRKLKHPIFGMPILVKDNINVKAMPTTAGAVALLENYANDAFIIQRLKSAGALILGKANLSEWAYFFCGDCPSGYSAVGGQTLNPYGRRSMDTGGSSSGSGVAVAANFCVAALGSETSGSILSPSSQNSVVGLKPTIGLVSRRGIVPISSTLDTAGPMAKNVTDTAIVLDAIYGYDDKDSKSINTEITGHYYNLMDNNALIGKRFGAVKRLLEDTLYVNAISHLKSKGTIIVEIQEEKIDLPDFLRLLNLDMKTDLKAYLKQYVGNKVTVKSVQDVIDFNRKDSVNTMAYGQRLFLGIVKDTATTEEFNNLKLVLNTNGRNFFDTVFKAHDLDGFLSVNNYHASYAAVAEYPAITVPMGYNEDGIPKGLTFIGKPFSEKNLLQWAYAYETVSRNRMSPINYN